MNGRLYDPLLGRFLSPDPIVANPGDGQQWNLYSYAMNSPLSYIDPSGLTTCAPVYVCQRNAGLPGAGRGGYGTRTVSGWGTYVTFGIYHRIVRIWRSSSSFNSWGGGSYDGGWSDDTYWEDVQQSVVYPIVHLFFWAFQVVEQGAANEPASSHSPHSGSAPGKNGPLLPRQQAARRAIEALIKGGVLDPNKVFDGDDARDRAAIEVLDAVHPISEKYNVEIGGTLVNRGDGVSYGSLTVGDDDSVRIDHMGASGVFHTHPGGIDFFSNQRTNPPGPADAGLVDLHGIPNYMSSQRGGPNGPVVIKVCTPGSARCRPDFDPSRFNGFLPHIQYRGLSGEVVR